MRGEEFEAGAAVGGDGDGEAFHGEQGLERFADGGFVVDDEDAALSEPRTGRSACAGDSPGAARCSVSVDSDSSWISVNSDMHGLPVFGCFRDGRGGLREGGRGGTAAGNSRRKTVPTPTSALHVDLAGVLLNDAVGDGEAEAGAFVLAIAGLVLVVKKGS